ncbi:MAG: PAS domain S-box protein [Dehalococcoidia bacterium]|nr:PAS domain S-box protein [Dehalococcoidia bacterium]
MTTTGSARSTRDTSALDFLIGGGEMGERMRAFDWSTTPLGAPEEWPQSLKTAVRIVLTSRQPMFVWWGPELINLYNDAYKTIVGGKHPQALAQPASVVWREIWDQVGPRARRAVARNEGTYDEALLLIMDRNGYQEETYYTFSYSPLPDDAGGVGGIICANTEDTATVLSERGLATFREIAARTGDARSVEDACRGAAAGLATNRRDLPFAAIYLLDASRSALDLRATSGISVGHRAAPARAELAGLSVWPVDEVIRSGGAVHLHSPIRALPHGDWDVPTWQVVVAPIATPAGVAGVLVAGLNPYRLYNEPYARFISLVCGQIGAAIAGAQAYQQERERAERLAEIDRAKTTFFTNISHEFRTPLTLMLGPLAEALSDTDDADPAVQRERLDTAHRNATRLLRLVNGLLDFSRIEAGRVDAAYERVDLATLTRDLASMFRSAFERAGVALVVECDAIDRPIYVDRSMWEKIVLNLLSNAFKFTLTGAVTVRLAEDEHGAALTVRDTGAGIAPEDLPRLFERFHRIETAGARTQEGSGIGLALVQELVRLHGGSIAVTSEAGAGTEFTVRIPSGSGHLPAGTVREADAPVANPLSGGGFVDEALRWLPRTEESAAVDDGRLATATAPRTATILIADDNADMREYLERLLSAHWRVEAVTDGEQALARVRAGRPDVLITDVMMPNRDGFGLVRAIRDTPELEDLPVILVSARAGEESRIEGLAAGVDDYLVKPFSSRELVSRVSALVETSRLRRQLGAPWSELSAGRAAYLAVTDAHGNPRYQSAGWIDYLGATARALPDAGWSEAVHPGDRAGLMEHWTQAMAAPEAFEHTQRVRRSDGVYRWFTSRFAPVVDDDGTLTSWFISAVDVDERMRYEDELRASEAKYRTLFESMDDGFCILEKISDDPMDFRYVEANPAFSAHAGVGGVAGRSVREVFPTDGEERFATYDAVLRTGEPVRMERVLASQGRMLDLYIFRPEGETSRIAVIFQDITESKRTEVALRESEERARLAVSVAQLGTWTYDIDEDTVALDRRMCEIWGQPPAEPLMPLPLLMERIHPADRERVGDAINASLSPGSDGSYDIEYRIISPDGSERWVLANGQAQFEGSGERRVARAFAGTALDITERKQDEALLVEQSSLLEQIAAGRPLGESLAALTAAIERLQPGTRAAVVLADEARERFAEISSTGIDASFGERVKGARIEEFAIGTCGVAVFTGERVACTDIARDGRWSPEWRELCLAHGISACHSEPVLLARGDAVASLLLCFETPRAASSWELKISQFGAHVVSIAIERERVATALREREEDLAAQLADARQLQQVSGALIHADDVDAIYDRILAGAMALLRAECGSMQIFDAEREELRLIAWKGFHPDAAKFWQVVRAGPGTPCSAALETGARAIIRDVETCDFIVGTEDEEHFRASRIRAAQSTPLVSLSGRLVGMISTHWREPHEPAERELRMLDLLARQAADVIERKEAETKLRAALAAKDEFLGLVSHELRTPLTTILGNADVLRRSADRMRPEERAEALEDMRTDARRLARIIDNMLALARIERGQASEREPIRLDRVIARAVALHRERYPAREVRTAIDAAVPVVEANAEYVSQIVENLLTNAEKYGDASAPIDISATADDGRIVVSVADRGKGIASEDARRIFDPFVRGTATAHLPGIGIGLTVCTRLVEAQGGRIWATPRAGGGSIFAFTLPPADCDNDAELAAAAGAAE